MKHRLWVHFKNMKLAKKMMLVYVLLLAVSFSIAVSALQISLNIYDEKLYEKSLQELDFFTQKVNDSLKEVENLSRTIAMDADIQEQLIKISSLNYLSAEYSYEMYRFRLLLLDELNSHEIIKNIIFTDKNSEKFTVGVDCGVIDQADYEGILQEFSQAKGGYVVKDPTVQYPYQLSGRDVLMHLNASLDYLGSILITCDVSGQIGKKVKDLQAQHSTLFVYSHNGMIYSGEEESPPLPSLEESQGWQVVRYQNQQYFMCYLKARNGWMYVNLFPYSEIFGQTMMVRYLMIGGFLLIFLCSVLLMRKLAAFITKPLVQLSESMRIVETGDFERAKQVLNPEAGGDETGLMAQEFQVMLDKINTLIYENYEKQLLLQDTRYKMLQAQINPHFLYNTLNALNWMVKAKRNEDAGKVIVELGQLLRASFAKEPYVSAASEVGLAKSYITIQKFRYSDRADFSIETQGNLENCTIPHMTLQPLVENAIYHGVENSPVPCKVCVKVIEKDNGLLLEVLDTGPGMTPEELEAVQDGTIQPKGHGIGLKNIRERLKIACAASEFTIESKLGQGTVARIWIPKQEENTGV